MKTKKKYIIAISDNTGIIDIKIINAFDKSDLARKIFTYYTWSFSKVSSWNKLVEEVENVGMFIDCVEALRCELN